MVTRHDHDGVLQLTGFFQGLQGPGNHLVEMLDFDIVVENITTHYWMVGKDFRDDHLRRILAGSLSRTKFECAVRFTRPQPKAKRLIFLHFSEKIIEVGRVISVSHRPERRFQATLLELFARWIGIATPRSETTGTPSFTRKTDRISGVGQDLGVSNELLG